MNKIFISIVVLVVIGSVAYFVWNNNNSGNQPEVTMSPSPDVSGLPLKTPTPSASSTNLPQTSSEPTPTATPKPSATPNPTPTPAPLIHSVTIINFAFKQQVITVRKGDTITWTNKDSAAHTVTGDGGLNSSLLNRDGTYSFTFNNTGTFNYHCTPHPYMTGTVIVTQ